MKKKQIFLYSVLLLANFFRTDLFCMHMNTPPDLQEVYRAIEEDCDETAVQCILSFRENGWDVNEKNDSGYPLLIFAIDHWKRCCFDALIEDKKIDIDAVVTKKGDREGWSALHFLVKGVSFYFELMIKKLFPKFSKKIDINRRTASGLTPLLLLAEDGDRLGIAEFFLKQEGIDFLVKTPKDYCKPGLFAWECGREFSNSRMIAREIKLTALVRPEVIAGLDKPDREERVGFLREKVLGLNEDEIDTADEELFPKMRFTIVFSDKNIKLLRCLM